MKVYQAIAQAIEEEGIDTLFAVMGDANQDLIVELCENHGVKLIHAKHEQSAVAMADGYTRFSGKIGLASVTQGPGLTNATTSLVGARDHKSPVLILAGATSLSDPHNPQGLVNQQNLSILTTQASINLVHPKNTDYALSQIFGYLRGKKGPIVLNLPQDIQKAEMIEKNWKYKKNYLPLQRQIPTEENLNEAQMLIQKAENPAFICGVGAVYSEAESEIKQLAGYLGAPIATSLYAKGFCKDYPLSLGVSGGLGTGLAIKALKQCDLLIAVGASLNQWTTHFGSVIEGKKVLQIDNRQEAFGKYVPPTVGLQGDAKVTVAALYKKIQKSIDKKEPDQEIKKLITTFKPENISYNDGTTIDPRRAAHHIEKYLPMEERIIVTDGGHAAMVNTQIISSSDAKNWSNAVDFGAIGQGLALSLGACFARPGKRITHLTADASFMMNVADFHTAVIHNLPLTVFIFNDNAIGQEKHDLAHKKLNTKYADVAQPDFAKLATAFGAKGFTIEHPKDLNQIQKVLEIKEGPVVVNVRINGEIELPVSWEIAQHLS